MNFFEFFLINQKNYINFNIRGQKFYIYLTYLIVCYYSCYRLRSLIYLNFSLKIINNKPKL